MPLRVCGTDGSPCSRRKFSPFPCVRSGFMTIFTTIFGPLLLFWATGRGSDVMQPMAILGVGGMIVRVLVTIYIDPCLFCAVQEWKWKLASRTASGATE